MDIGPISIEIATPFFVVAWIWTIAICFGSFRLWYESKSDGDRMLGTPRYEANPVWTVVLWFPIVAFSMLCALFVAESVQTPNNWALIIPAAAGAVLGTTAYIWVWGSLFK